MKKEQVWLRIGLIVIVAALPVIIALLPKFTGEITKEEFTLLTENPINRTIWVLVALEKGEKDKAEKVFGDIKKEILFEGFREKYSVHQRHMLAYFLLRIRSEGLEVEDKIIDQIEPWSITSSEISCLWIYLKFKELEKIGEFKDTTIPPVLQKGPPEIYMRDCSCCGFNSQVREYVAWKFGQGERPTKGEWAIVP